MGRLGWCKIEIHRAAGSLICCWTPLVEWEWNLFPCLQPFLPLRVFFPLQIISASKKSRRKTKDYILKPSCKKTKKCSPPNLSAWGVFFPSPKPFCLGFHLVCRTLNVLGCIAWWDLLSCIGVCMAQSYRLWGAITCWKCLVLISEEPLPTETSRNGHTKRCDAAESPQCPLGWRNVQCSKSHAFVRCSGSLSFSKPIFKEISSWKQFHEVLGQSSVLQTTHLSRCSGSLSFSKLIFKLINSWKQFHEVLGQSSACQTTRCCSVFLNLGAQR